MSEKQIRPFRRGGGAKKGSTKENAKIGETASELSVVVHVNVETQTNFCCCYCLRELCLNLGGDVTARVAATARNIFHSHKSAVFTLATTPASSANAAFFPFLTKNSNSDTNRIWPTWKSGRKVGREGIKYTPETSRRQSDFQIWRMRI